MSTEASEESESVLPRHVIDRAVRLSYAQAVIGTIYGSLTGGVFVLGYALKLGADNVQIGLMSTIPMFCVIVQLLSATIIERGASRRRLTVWASAFNVLVLGLIVLLPQVAVHTSKEVKIAGLIGIVALMTLMSQISGNARSSWVGDLIPAKTRGRFFGRMALYAGLIGIIFSAIGGSFLDHVKKFGLAGFNWLFLIGMSFGLLNAMLYVPQADVPVTKHESGGKFLALVKHTFRNGPLMVVLAYAIVVSMQSIAAPFYATYCLRDLKMSFLGFSLLNGLSMLTAWISSPFWGRIVDRYGCRPIIIACSCIVIPVPIMWYWLTSARLVYMVTGPLNLLFGFSSAAGAIALGTLLYKLTEDTGRSMQLAIYSLVTALVAAPFPTIGGHLPGWLHALGIHADVRATFYCTIPIAATAALLARRIKEPDAARTGELMRELPAQVRNSITSNILE